MFAFGEMLWHLRWFTQAVGLVLHIWKSWRNKKSFCFDCGNSVLYFIVRIASLKPYNVCPLQKPENFIFRWRLLWNRRASGTLSLFEVASNRKSKFVEELRVRRCDRIVHSCHSPSNVNTRRANGKTMQSNWIIAYWRAGRRGPKRF